MKSALLDPRNPDHSMVSGTESVRDTGTGTPLVLPDHPLDWSLTQYIKAAESHGLSWMIRGGDRDGTTVRLCFQTDQDYRAAALDEQPCVAFYRALTKVLS